jgi:single-stranded-DNA-specific exonuclease
VLIAGTEAAWKGSGRSTGAFDLHGALAACAPLLERFGGHRAAAGLSIEPGQVEAFADAFAAQADAVLTEEDLRPVTKIDAVVPGRSLSLDLCAELARLRPFGLGNPGVTLLVAGCEVTEAATVGDGKHLRFRIAERGRPAGSAIAFGLGGQLDRFRREGEWDVAFRLEENRWNGTVSPQLVVRQVFETPERYAELRTRFAAEWESKQFSADGAAIFEELGLADGIWRSLLESERFRALLVEPPLARAA